MSYVSDIVGIIEIDLRSSSPGKVTMMTGKNKHDDHI